MMNNILPLIRGQCPICNKNIMNDKKTSYANGGMEFCVKWTDGKNGNFAICSDCFKTLTKEQVEKITQQQILNWGIEIQKQLSWYIKEAVHFRVAKWAKEEKDISG